MFQTYKSLNSEYPGNFSEEKKGAFSLYMEVDHLEELFDKIASRVEVLKPISTTHYGREEFAILDNNGYVLTFAEAG